MSSPLQRKPGIMLPIHTLYAAFILLMILREELDNQMGQLQHDSEKLITGLDNAMKDLRSEKLAMSRELEKATTQVEHAEDALYDLQQQKIYINLTFLLL